MKVSMVVVGLTVVSFATSAPELIVSVYSALTGHSDIALGNVIGSNITNITLVLGVTALIFPLGFQKRLYRFDLPMMLFASALFGVFLYSDSGLNFFEGFCFVLLICLLTIYLIRDSQNNDNLSFDKNTQQTSLVKMLLYIVFGGGCLNGAAEIILSLTPKERAIPAAPSTSQLDPKYKHPPPKTI
jgi:cation:H+ antiporter